MTVVSQCSLHKNLITNSAIKCECGRHIKHMITIRRNGWLSIGRVWFQPDHLHFDLVPWQTLKELSTFVGLLGVLVCLSDEAWGAFVNRHLTHGLKGRVRAYLEFRLMTSLWTQQPLHSWAHLNSMAGLWTQREGVGSGHTVGRMRPELLRFGLGTGLNSVECWRKVEEDDIAAMKGILPKSCYQQSQ